MRVLGLDPGLSGGAAVVEGFPNNSPKCLGVIDMPTTGEKWKRRIDPWPLINFIAEFAPGHAFIERAQAMPDQGSSSGFIYGRAVGYIECCVLGLSIPMETIESTAWKKFHGLKGGDKENSRQRAIMRFPEVHSALQRKMDHNRAESVLIAEFGLALVSHRKI